MSAEKGKEVIRIEAAAVAALEERLDKDFERALDIIFHSKGRIIVSGMGKSGIVAKKIAATLSSTGTPAIFLHPVEGVHGDMGVVQRNDVVIAISKSGNTDELYQLVPLFKRMGIPIITLTGNRDSPLAKRSDVVLDVSVREEACPYDLIPTASTTATVAMGDALAIALLHRRDFSPEDFALLHPGGALGRRLLLTVEDVMLTDDEVPIVDEDFSMEKTILEMTAKRGVTSVVDRNGTLVGIFVYGDLGRLLEKTKDIFDKKVREVMIRDPKTITQDRLAAEALQLMEEYGITSLVVIDAERRPIGIVHLHDIMRAGVY
ncbi:MAG: KpsF/GutQ family sugar-phosphate isomerase [Gemmatimonadota bacterium]|nr:MAG: KpsF/GutQ family sugar-phosphate isomerase [Gemmatimonadota bacterium]